MSVPKLSSEERARKLYGDAKDLVKDDSSRGSIQEALVKLQSAQQLFPTVRYARRIEDLQAFLISASSEESDSSDQSRSNDYSSGACSSLGECSERPSGVSLNNSEVEFIPKAKTETANHRGISGGSSDGSNILTGFADLVIEPSVGQAMKSTDSALISNGTSNEAVPNNQEPSTSKEATKNDSKFVEVEGHRVNRKVYNKLYPYQTEGLRWMLELYNVFRDKRGRDYKLARGAILADDMGLGKTVQTISLLCTLLMENDSGVNNVLIVAPVSLLMNWAKEFRQWYKDAVKVYSFHNGSRTKKLENLRTVQRHGGVLLTTYDLARNFEEEMNNFRSKKFVWDYLVLDEAHKIKNPTKTSKSLNEFNATYKLAITGTPVQNNLRELHAIYHFVNGCLGQYPDFKVDYEMPIERAREKGATNSEKRTGTRLAQSLRLRYERYFKRRTKVEVFSKRKSISGDSSLQLTMPKKFDWVLWVTLTAEQVSMYKDFLNTDSVRELLRSTASGLVQLTNLKKLCDHPRRMPQSVCDALLGSLNDSSNNVQQLLSGDDKLVDVTTVDPVVLLKESGKVAVLLALLLKLREERHRTLIFSQSTVMLDIIQRVLAVHNFRMARLDGRVVKMAERDKIVQTFQTDASVDVCLLTTQVGGVGLTLTAADRVVIYDPSWNPATDSQAIDRAYRIGQNKTVVVYRLITCGTVEEKIFRRQVFKKSIINQMVESEQDPSRYFTKQDLREVFNFKDATKSETCDLIDDLHGHQRKSCSITDDHRDFVGGLEHVYGISDHDFLFSNKEGELADDVDDIAIIEAKVAHAHTKMAVASAALNDCDHRPLHVKVPDRNNDKEERPENPGMPNPTPVITLDDNSFDQSEFNGTLNVLDASVLLDKPSYANEDDPIEIDTPEKAVDDSDRNNTSRASSIISHQERDRIANVDDDDDVVGEQITGDTDCSDDELEDDDSLRDFIDDDTEDKLHGEEPNGNSSKRTVSLTNESLNTNENERLDDEDVIAQSSRDSGRSSNSLCDPAEDEMAVDSLLSILRESDIEALQNTTKCTSSILSSNLSSEDLSEEKLRTNHTATNDKVNASYNSSNDAPNTNDLETALVDNAVKSTTTSIESSLSAEIANLARRLETSALVVELGDEIDADDLRSSRGDDDILSDDESVIEDITHNSFQLSDEDCAERSSSPALFDDTEAFVLRPSYFRSPSMSMNQTSSRLPLGDRTQTPTSVKSAEASLPFGHDGDIRTPIGEKQQYDLRPSTLPTLFKTPRAQSQNSTAVCTNSLTTDCDVSSTRMKQGDLGNDSNVSVHVFENHGSSGMNSGSGFSGISRMFDFSGDVAATPTASTNFHQEKLEAKHSVLEIRNTDDNGSVISVGSGKILELNSLRTFSSKSTDVIETSDGSATPRVIAVSPKRKSAAALDTSNEIWQTPFVTMRKKPATKNKRTPLQGPDTKPLSLYFDDMMSDDDDDNAPDVANKSKCVTVHEIHDSHEELVDVLSGNDEASESDIEIEEYSREELEQLSNENYDPDRERSLSPALFSDTDEIIYVQPYSALEQFKGRSALSALHSPNVGDSEVNKLNFSCATTSTPKVSNPRTVTTVSSPKREKAKDSPQVLKLNVKKRRRVISNFDDSTL